MATLQVSTASNAPTVDPDRVDELRSFLDEWLLETGPFDTLSVDVVEPNRDSDTDTGEPHPPYLALYGYASFGPAHRPTVRDAAREQLDAAGDLEGLSDDDREAIINAETQNLVFEYLIRRESPVLQGGRESDHFGITAVDAQSGVSSCVHFHSEWRVYTCPYALCRFDEADQYVRGSSSVRRGRGVASTPVGRFCRALERNQL